MHGFCYLGELMKKDTKIRLVCGLIFAASVALAALAPLMVTAPKPLMAQYVPPGIVSYSVAKSAQTGLISPTTIASCPSSATTVCTYRATIQMSCNQASDAMATGTPMANLIYPENVSGGSSSVTYSNSFTNLFSSCSTLFVNTVRGFSVASGGTIQYSVTGTLTGSYSYDLTIFLERIQVL